MIGNSSRTRAGGPDGAVMFTALAGFSDPIGAAIGTEYISKRSADPSPGNQGWSTHSITPLQEPMTVTGNTFSIEPSYHGDFSDDLSRGVFRAWSPLTENANVQEATNLYVRDDLLTPGPGNYALVSDCPACLFPILPTSKVTQPPHFASASADFGNIVFESPINLAAGASGSNPKTYEWDHGTVNLVGVLPNGTSAVRSIPGRGILLGTQLRHTARPISGDGSRIFFTVGPNNTTHSGQVYARINSRTTVQLNASERNPAEAAQAATYWNSSADGSRVFFTSAERLTDDDSPGPAKLYMWEQAESDETQEVAVDAGSGTFTLGFQGLNTEAIDSNAGPEDVQAALESLASVKPGNVEVDGGPGDIGATSPYEVTFTGDFAGVNVPQLSANAAGLGGGSATVTTTEPVQNLTLMNVDQEPADGGAGTAQGVLGSSDDGKRVYFLASGQLVPGEPLLNTGVGIYLWDEGSLSYIGRLSNSGFDSVELLDITNLVFSLKQVDVSANGGHLVFGASSGQGLLSAHGDSDYDHGNCIGDGLNSCRELYVYSAETDTLQCASCNPSGETATAHANGRIRAFSGAARTTRYQTRLVSDDGRYVFFSSGEALVDEDQNGRVDAYVFDTEAGEPHLLSSGAHPSDSYFLDTSGSGRDAYFITRERLVGWDEDGAYDLYSARVDGGFPEPEQSGSVACESNDRCKGPAQAGPEREEPASSSIRSIGNGTAGVPRRMSRAQCLRVRRNLRRSRTRTVRLKRALSRRTTPAQSRRYLRHLRASARRTKRMRNLNRRFCMDTNRRASR